MKIAADFSKRVVVHSEKLAWVASPMAGVDRRALDRVGDEVARATTIVRYAPGSEFSPHTHTGGEEFVVLEGPPESKHKPGSKNGCIIFVKLWQFQPDDRTHVRLQTDLMQSAAHPNFKNVAVTPLYKDTFEEISLLHFKPNADMVINAQGGAELLVLEGSLDEQADTLVKNSWLRVPINSTVNVKAGNNGAKVWLKTGHLTDVSNQISRVQNT